MRNEVVSFAAVDTFYPIYDGHQRELPLLKGEVIEAVVETYRRDRELSQSLRYLQSEQFQELDEKRKSLVFEGFVRDNQHFRKHREDTIRLLS